MEKTKVAATNCGPTWTLIKTQHDQPTLIFPIGCFDERNIHHAYRSFLQLITDKDLDTNSKTLVLLGDNGYLHENPNYKQLEQSIIAPARVGLELQSSEKLSAKFSQIRVLLGNHEHGATKSQGGTQPNQAQRNRNNTETLLAQERYIENSTMMTESFSATLSQHNGDNQSIISYTIQYDTTDLYANYQLEKHCAAIVYLLREDTIELKKVVPLLLGHHNPAIPTDEKIHKKSEPYYPSLPKSEPSHHYIRIQAYLSELNIMINNEIYRQPSAVKTHLQERYQLYKKRLVSICAHTHTASLQCDESGTTIVAPAYAPSNLATYGGARGLFALEINPNKQEPVTLYRTQKELKQAHLPSAWEEHALALPCDDSQVAQLKKSSAHSYTFQLYNQTLNSIVRRCQNVPQNYTTIESFLFLILIWTSPNIEKLANTCNEDNAPEQLFKDNIYQIIGSGDNKEDKIKKTYDAINKLLVRYSEKNQPDPKGAWQSLRRALFDCKEILISLHTIENLYSTPGDPPHYPTETSSSYYPAARNKSATFAQLMQSYQHYHLTKLARQTTNGLTPAHPLPEELEHFITDHMNKHHPIDQQENQATLYRIIHGQKTISDQLASFYLLVKLMVFIANLPPAIVMTVFYLSHDLAKKSCGNTTKKKADDSIFLPPQEFDEDENQFLDWCLKKNYLIPPLAFINKWSSQSWMPSTINHWRSNRKVDALLNLLTYMSTAADIYSACGIFYIAFMSPSKHTAKEYIDQSRSFLPEQSRYAIYVSAAAVMLISLLMRLETNETSPYNIQYWIKAIEPIFFANFIYKVLATDSNDSHQLIPCLFITSASLAIQITRRQLQPLHFNRGIFLLSDQHKNKIYNLLTFIMIEATLGLTSLIILHWILGYQDSPSQYSGIGLTLIGLSTLFNLTSAHFHPQLNHQQYCDTRLAKAVFTEVYFSYWKTHILIENLLRFASNDNNKTTVIVLSSVIVYLKAHLIDYKNPPPSALIRCMQELNELPTNSVQHTQSASSLFLRSDDDENGNGQAPLLGARQPHGNNPSLQS